MDMFKSIAPTEMKLADTGEVEAVIATFDTIDKDHDVTRKGFFGAQPAAIVWSHDWSNPVGKGSIFETDVDARFTGSFFLETTAGREAYQTVKAMGPMQEWSYGFDILNGGSEAGQFDGQDVRFLQAGKDGPGAKVYEVSPVLVGAGEGTRTTNLKEGFDRFVDELDRVRRDVHACFIRAVEVAEMRTEKGKGPVSDDARSRLIELADGLAELKVSVDTLVTSSQEEARNVMAEYARYQRTLARLSGGV